ncbi:MAG: histidine--tRNA ligase [Defluviitaleaceae bacterium]|nr:histidine--tRNA ligase [Defluviitaleaceae bacterium]
MAITITKPKGTQDIFGPQAALWQYVEGKIRNVAALFAIEEIRTPIFENVELFVRSVGEATDIVQKEMYTFTDAGGRTYALTPEGTAPTVRAYLENSLHNLPMPAKFYYVCHNFRAERQQKGRYRQFRQFGVEYFGSYSAAADAELISVAHLLLTQLDIENFVLRINSIGDKTCREAYNEALLTFLDGHKDNLCGLCQERMGKNPMRVLDCKNPACGAIVSGAPVPLDHLSAEAAAHFEELQRCLTLLGIPFVVDKTIVRGLDYYTRTVFEFTSADLGAQSAICGGGRYDNLIESHGGQPTGAVGFGMGIERLLIILEEQGKLPQISQEVTVFLGGMGEAGAKKARLLAHQLRQSGISAICDLTDRSIKAQMKYADKLGAKYSLVIGESELETGVLAVKCMENGQVVQVQIDKIMEHFA